MAGTYEDFRRDDAAYERDLYHREELERDDIMSLAVDPWLRAHRMAARRTYANTTRAMTEEEAA